MDDLQANFTQDDSGKLWEKLIFQQQPGLTQWCMVGSGQVWKFRNLDYTSLFKSEAMK